MAKQKEYILNEGEIEAIILAVKSAFLKLKNLYQDITPIFNDYGFNPPSAGVIARDLSEKIESSIVQHCSTFARGEGFADLQRMGQRWEVKICKNSGLTINQSSTVAGENYIVVNYHKENEIKKIWVLWNAEDKFFSPRKSNSNARGVLQSQAKESIQLLYDANGRQLELIPQTSLKGKKVKKTKLKRAK